MSARLSHLGVWAMQIVGASLFVAAGAAKLVGLRKYVDSFEHLGWAPETRLLIGAAEVAGGLLLLAPPTAGYAAALLAVLMAGALAAHLLVLGGSLAPAAALLVLMAAVTWTRWPWRERAPVPRRGSARTQRMARPSSRELPKRQCERRAGHPIR